MRKGTFVFAIKDGEAKKITLPFIPVEIYEVKIFIADIPETKKFECHYPMGQNSIMETWNFLMECSHILILMRKFSPEIIVHEFSHCVDMIYEYIAEPPSYQGETRAYLIEYLFREFNKYAHKLVLK